ncbi:hypothetical protein SAMN05216282_11193 [Cryobacterium psychrotolerans]|uniref:Uncharacterized protein n=1 Tax=Cryobacterium psychrotolerans TaxID=386301 RepID=A0A1G9EA94_9MICO|nr:hypothetical protein [Cryobacterium psychrotolerans]TFD86368.1 hypothetical protein E3T56_07200 [Cryobacterium psychrotolerans]SDK72976.1 hypothetical protein SAMN05216282_11193 [Cryobacterium psychrotolerans]
MTLGNSPQPPLTRRQERELARQQGLLSTEDDLRLSAGDPAPDVESDVKPADVKAADVKPAAVKPDVVAESVPVSAFAPRGAEKVPAEKAMTSTKRQAPERTLTRRQLRAIKAAESGEPEATDGEDVSPDAETHTTGGLNPPVGHWSLDRGDDHTPTVDEGQTFDQFMSRGTGGSGSPTTTSALILPSIPLQGSSSGPLTSTGEILITGSYDLPRSLGSTGHHPGNFDSSDMDQSDDHDDAGGYNSTVAPVSASRAVSTHASNRGLVAPPQKSGNSLPTVLAITAAVLAVGVLALFVLGYVFNIF